MSIFPSYDKALSDLSKAITSPFKNELTVQRADDYQEGFQFGEVKPDGSFDNEFKVVLNGRNMPHVPFKSGGKLRVNKSWYAGNNEPNFQILGSEETDLSVNGRFYSKIYKDKSFYEAPSILKEFIDQLKRRGKLMKITLGPWVRYGFLSDTSWEETHRGDITYTLTFNLSGDHLPADFYKLEDTKQTPLPLNNALIQQMADLQEEYAERDSSLDASLSDKLNGFISDVAEVVATATSFVDKVISEAEAIDDSIKRAIGMIKYARAYISKTKRRLGLLTFGGIINNPAKKFRSTAKTQATHTSLNTIQVSLANLQKNLEALRKTVPKARYLVKDGDSLQKISMKFFNTFENAQKIYDHNKLTTTALTRGSILEIPNI